MYVIVHYKAGTSIIDRVVGPFVTKIQARMNQPPHSIIALVESPS